MKLLLYLFGQGRDLSAMQMGFRAIVIFFITLILIRISGRRSFGIQTSFDNVLVILLGAVLSRAIVGASPFFPTVIACLIISVLHRLFGLLNVYSPFFSRMTKGNKIAIYKNGKWNKRNMVRALVSQEEAMLGVRQSLQQDSLDNVEAIYMEFNGHISAVKKDIKAS